MSVRDVVILGSGPAGLTAAIYAGRAGFSPLVIEGMSAGGQLTQTVEVENFPGFAEPVSGSVLMDAMHRQAERCGAEFMLDEVTAVDLAGDVKRFTTMTGETVESRSAILATGATARWLGCPGESEYRGRGISACATCDGAFFKGKDVAVIGGGDTAAGDALYLSRICRSVLLVHRRDALRAAKVLADRVAATPNIHVAWHSIVASFLGEGGRLAGLRLKSTVDGSVSETPCSGAFVAIGHSPATALFAGQVELNGDGYIACDRGRTSVAGVFAAGDAVDPYYKQAVVAAGSGATAALEAEKYLAGR